MKLEGYFLDGIICKQQALLHLLKQPLFQQMTGTDAKLPLNTLIECHTTQMHHIGIVIDAVRLGDMPLQELLVLIGIVVLRRSEWEVEAVSIETVQLQENS